MLKTHRPIDRNVELVAVASGPCALDVNGKPAILPHLSINDSRLVSAEYLPDVELEDAIGSHGAVKRRQLLHAVPAHNAVQRIAHPGHVPIDPGASALGGGMNEPGSARPFPRRLRMGRIGHYTKK